MIQDTEYYPFCDPCSHGGILRDECFYGER